MGSDSHTGLIDEAARATALRSYGICGTMPEPAYDEISALAAQICGCPAAIISFADEQNLWSKSMHGLPFQRGPLPREMFMCSSVIYGSDLLIVPDLTKDARFADLPVVVKEPHARFYCGMPLINPEGHALGALCVVDFQPRELTFEQGEALRRLAHQVVMLLELKRNLHELDRAQQELAAQRETSERLLRNMLPPAIAEELKTRNQVAPRFFGSATIIFADFEGFTRLAERLEPKEIIGQLDGYFSAFDEIAERRGLEMLKTIGDAYMCVGGLPEANHSHSVDACLAALEMQRLMADTNREREKFRLPVWPLRIGIHTGPVIAGVVGRRKFIYDVWGDAVNVAARMESAGAAGKINVSEAIYQRTKTLFEFEPRGKIDCKNKGQLDMFYLDRIKPSLSRDQIGSMPNDAFDAECIRLFPGFALTTAQRSAAAQPALDA